MLINLRNALMSGKRLPYDAEVEYLESTGTQWINTGVNGAADLYYSLTIQPTYSSGDRKYFGSYPSGLTLAQLNGNWRFLERNWILSSVAVDSTTASVVERRSDGLYVNGAKVADIWDGARASTGLILFGQRTDSGVSLSYCRVYACKIYLGAVLVRDYIPVRKGTVGYLYDRVSGKLFGNAGTGDFLYGQDVVPVEYIESHGTEYIDTGVMSSRCYGAYLDFKAIDFTSYMFFVSNATADDFCVGTNANSTVNPYSGRIRRSLWYSGSIDKTAFVALSCKGGKILLNDVEKGTYDDTLPLAQNDNTIRMFGLSGTQRLSKSAIRRLDLYDSSQEAIFKALPVRVGTDATSWEGAMMDTLTRRIYRNAGTGAFTYGNDLKYPIPAE